MPTISQLPQASTVSASDEIPISQGGNARATSVGALLASTQPAVIVNSGALLGRTSVGSGGPEQVEVGIGIGLSNGTLVADGLDHAAFPAVSNLSSGTELVISNQGTPMLLQASLLRGLFSAGPNIAIDPNGIISTTATVTAAEVITTGSSIRELQVVTDLAAQDLVAVSHAGSDYAIAYSNFLSGVTIDQAQAAAAVNDSDTIWAAQGSNVMTSQTFGAIWVWVAKKLPTFKAPVVEITTNTNLDTTVHNGRILVCSKPMTVTPLVANMGSGFHCTIINASASNVTFASSFVSSTGNLVLTPWQTAIVSCVTYSGGTIAFASMPAAASAAAVPGQVTGLSSSSSTTTSISLLWQSPSSGGVVSWYIVQFRPTGTTSWSSSPPVAGTTGYQLAALQPATSYDITVTAQNTTGPGAASTTLTALTATVAQATLPSQVSGLTATPTSSSVVQLTWSGQTGTSAPSSFTGQYRITGSSAWTSIIGMTGTGGAITGLQAATSYDFSVIGLNGSGAGPMSAVVTAVTPAASIALSSITWNLLPSGTYTHSSGTIGVNAHVSPATSPIQFGFSLSAVTPPTVWTAATLVNSDLWGCYLPTPTAGGAWYTWAEGLGGSGQIVSPSSFLVQ